MKDFMALQNSPTMVRRIMDKDGPESKEGLFLVERRRHPRISIELPFDYSLFETGGDRRGILTDASEGGLLVHLVEELDVGSLLRIEILFSRGTELVTIESIVKVVWSDLAARESWGEYRYGLQFLSFFQGDIHKLKILLKEVGQRQ
jgi:c-di-GMP-binding flagellar brake protein YcgR